MKKTASERTTVYRVATVRVISVHRVRRVLKTVCSAQSVVTGLGLSSAMTELRPFMRWAGGKAWAGDELVQFARSLDHGRPVAYCEPFLGGGSLFLRMLSEGLILKDHCYLGDLAPEAFLAWKGVLTNPVRTAMQAQRWLSYALESDSTERAYYELRGIWNAYEGETVTGERSLTEVAGLLIAINRLSFKGLLRVNPSGDFNVPYGHLPNPSVDRDTIIGVGQAMQAVGVTLTPGGWDETVYQAGCMSPSGLLVVDPPYAGTTHVAYTQRGWTNLDRVQLSARCRECSEQWSVFATDAQLPDSWDAWRWGHPRPFIRPGGMGDGEGRGRDERGEIIIRVANPRSASNDS